MVVRQPPVSTSFKKLQAFLRARVGQAVHDYAMVAWVSEVGVVRGEKYLASA